jgi:signal transduction histidine kinase
MKRLRRIEVLYGVLVFLIVTIGVWWAYYLTQEGHHFQDYQMQRLTTDKLHAIYLIQTVPGVAHDPVGLLGERYPHLHFHRVEAGWEVQIDERARAAIVAEAKRRQRMFIGEGFVFLILLAAGTTILTHASRRERDFKRARELFLAGATHEFKTPLASIRLYAETLQRPGLAEKDQVRIHAAVIENVERLESLVEQVLSVSRDESDRHARIERFDVGDEVTNLIEGMGAFLESRDARLTLDLPSGRLLRGDRQALRVAVRNLVQNAVIHGPPPVEVRVALATDEHGHHLSVVDNGPGIPRREHRRVFESFYRGEAAHSSLNSRPGGSGLGLYLVERNVHALGGKVSLDSTPGEGSTFTLHLPSAAPEES